MDHSAYLRLVRGETTGVLASTARLGLRGLSVAYGLAVRARNQAYDRGWTTIHHAQIPVISVGNLTLGGTGKTPLVEWICRRLREDSLRVAILSRGYGGQSGLNDEGRVLEENLPDVPHLQDPDRARLAEIAVEELESEILVLDDGFQHRRLARDLDVVLLDALDPFGQGYLTPRGLLREPVKSLLRSGLVILSRADLVDAATRAAIRAEAERRAGPLKWVEARHAPVDLTGSGDGPEPVDRAVGVQVVAFCGLGNPEGFRRSLVGMGVTLVGFRTFPDHHPYSASDVAELATWAREQKADLILTTQKDSVKLRLDALGGIPLRALRIGLEFLEGRELLEEALRAVHPRRV